MNCHGGSQSYIVTSRAYVYLSLLTCILQMILESVRLLGCSKYSVFYRVRAYIQNGWADNIVDPNKPANVSSNDNAYLQKMLVDGWLDIHNVFTSIEEVPAFSNAQIVMYVIFSTLSLELWQMVYLQLTLNRWTNQQKTYSSVVISKTFSSVPRTGIRNCG